MGTSYFENQCIKSFSSFFIHYSFSFSHYALASFLSPLKDYISSYSLSAPLPKFSYFSYILYILRFSSLVFALCFSVHRYLILLLSPFTLFPLLYLNPHIFLIYSAFSGSPLSFFSRSSFPCSPVLAPPPRKNSIFHFILFPLPHHHHFIFLVHVHPSSRSSSLFLCFLLYQCLPLLLLPSKTQLSHLPSSP